MIVVPPRVPDPMPGDPAASFCVRLSLLGPHSGGRVQICLHVVPADVYEKRNSYRQLPLPAALANAVSSRPLPIQWAYRRKRRARPLPAAFVLMYHCEERVPISWLLTGKKVTAEENVAITHTVKTLVNWLIDTVALTVAEDATAQAQGRRQSRKRKMAEPQEMMPLYLDPGVQSGYTGVAFDPRGARRTPFHAHANMLGRHVSLGMFGTVVEAAVAYAEYIHATTHDARTPGSSRSRMRIRIPSAQLDEVSALDEAILIQQAAHGDCHHIDLMRARRAEVKAAQQCLASALACWSRDGDILELTRELEEAIGVAATVLMASPEIARAEARLAQLKLQG